jgi:hypothetical protein
MSERSRHFANLFLLAVVDQAISHWLQAGKPTFDTRQERIFFFLFSATSRPALGLSSPMSTLSKNPAWSSQHVNFECIFLVVLRTQLSETISAISNALQSQDMFHKVFILFQSQHTNYQIRIHILLCIMRLLVLIVWQCPTCFDLKSLKELTVSVPLSCSHSFDTSVELLICVTTRTFWKFKPL